MSPDLLPLATRALDLTAVLTHVVRLHTEQTQSRLFYWDRPYIVCVQLIQFLSAMGYVEAYRDGVFTGAPAPRQRMTSHIYDASSNRQMNEDDTLMLTDRILALSTLLCRFVVAHGKDGMGALLHDTRSYALAGQIDHLLRQAGYEDSNNGLSRTGQPVDANPFIDEDLLRTQAVCATAA